MAISPSKRLLLVAVLLLFFITMTARARSLRESRDEAKGQSNNLFKPNHEGAQDSNGDLDTMDYTPAKRNPPIHN
ncbi:uncharacterized protein LOC113873632 [Abrus precatorius]|uniref:Uncharacterized protein LOC113873632 n=1 Tax=Abrus precatorius TaxID=3816 RepID=A0A8B8MFZ3_ABRPR|nr:uncharacterized protein LOC113873632 [Abrus precatorius]